VGYGTVVPNGSLPVFSVSTEKEAKMLIAMTCPLSMDGDHYARELAEDQTLENLVAFSDRLQVAYDRFMAVKKSDKHIKRKR
jgi:hypothetical protein